MKVDLHMHSSASDGIDAPGELVALLKRTGITDFALTDHDTLMGLPAAREAANVYGLRMIDGVELSCGIQVEVHILGYGMKRPELMQSTLARLQRQRHERVDRMLERLDQAGIHLEVGDLPIASGGAPGRVHMARALVDHGYASSVNQAFQRYLVPGKPGYVERQKLTPEQGIQLIRESGGIAVLAHPGIIQADPALLPERIDVLMKMGLGGIEVHHPRHTPTQIQRFTHLAKQRGLIITGGSDSHGLPGGLMPGEGTTNWHEMHHDYNQFLSKIGFN
ncbi:PHP domain-containing protein [Eubacteriales bacterium OttesenSCG-928-N13]|nr:PHP domain-containing protein [Eubacteriales bacterium OttesenSCG-928-N13]